MAVQWSGWMRYLIGGLWNPDLGIQRAGPSGGNDAMQPVTDERAMQIGAVFRSIRIIAETCASIPLLPYQRSPGGDLTPVTDSHWLNELLYEPNSEMAGDEWAETQYAQMAGWGNAYTQIVPNDEGRATELWPYKVDRMEVEQKKNHELIYRYPNEFGVPQEKSPKRVMHFRAFSMDGVMGLSPLGLARQTMGLTVGAERYAASFFASGGRPSGIMTADRVLTEKQRDQIRMEYGGLAEGGVDGKRWWLLEGSLKYQAISVSPEDMQMLQTRVFQISDIARFFGVPLFLLMEHEKATSWGTGIEQMNLGFLTYTLRAYLQRMVGTFNRKIIPLKERHKLCVEIDERALLTLDSLSMKELYMAFATAGIMSRNEIRRVLKLPQRTDKNADSLTVQTALTPIENLGRVPTPAAPTLPAGA